MREEVQARMDERDRLSGHELQMQVEKRISEIKAHIIHAEHQAQQARSQEEKEMIDRQLEVLHQMEAKLQVKIQVYEEQQKKLQERETRV